jgi:hypothetical protein
MERHIAGRDPEEGRKTVTKRLYWCVDKVPAVFAWLSLALFTIAAGFAGMALYSLTALAVK